MGFLASHLQPMYPIAFEVRKQMGHVYIFRQRGRWRDVMAYYYPYNPKTDTQQAWRAVLATAVSNWQGFNDQTKGYYNALRYPLHMSGYNRYVRYYLNANK